METRQYLFTCTIGCMECFIDIVSIVSVGGSFNWYYDYGIDLLVVIFCYKFFVVGNIVFLFVNGDHCPKTKFCYKELSI